MLLRFVFGHVLSSAEDSDAASLGIRLAASAVSSLLIIVLLLFMVQRLRQRRLLITMRREMLTHRFFRLQYLQLLSLATTAVTDTKNIMLFTINL